MDLQFEETDYLLKFWYFKASKIDRRNKQFGERLSRVECSLTGKMSTSEERETRRFFFPKNRLPYMFIFPDEVLLNLRFFWSFTFPPQKSNFELIGKKRKNLSRYKWQYVKVIYISSGNLDYKLSVHEQRSLAGSSPWGHKELDMAEQLAYGYGYITLYNLYVYYYIYKYNYI